MSEYSRDAPFLASIKERTSLTGPQSQKNTQHLVIDLAESGLNYRAGDCVAILPANDPTTVAQIVDRLGATGEEVVTDRRGEASYPLLDFLRRRVDLAQTNRSFLELIAERGEHPLLSTLLGGDRDRLKQFQAEHHVWDLLSTGPRVTPQELASTLAPLMPRYYSIASSFHAVGEELHLTVANFRYLLNGIERRGVASHMLCERLPLGEPILPLYLQPTDHFLLPEEGDRPIIMIGPGTGIAPFRAFMQERLSLNHSGKSWLFFGDWTSKNDFLYRPFWEELVGKGVLRLSTAFSRDQAEKVYVQHRMWEERDDLWRWVEEGSSIYVCGDASQMAKDVEKMLLAIFETCGGLTPEEARAMLKGLRAEKRYLRDVY